MQGSIRGGTHRSGVPVSISKKTLVMADFDFQYLVKLVVSRYRLHSILADFVFDTDK